jgi:hypothetical protein
VKKEDHAGEFTELTIPNPFHEGPANAKGERLPITKAFRDGTITLLKVSRDPIVTDNVGQLTVEYKMERAGKLWRGFDVQYFHVSDSSGQFFRYTSRSGTGGYTETIGVNTAPWSDDPCWLMRFSLRREDDSKEVAEDEIFRFEKLPLPTNTSVPIGRELTRNGITLRLGTLEPLDRHGSSRITVKGWVRDDPVRRHIFVHDARDDQGRTRTPVGTNTWTSFASGPSGYEDHDPIFVVHPTPGAKSWDLALVPETVTQVEFTVQAPPVDSPAKKD